MKRELINLIEIIEDEWALLFLIKLIKGMGYKEKD